MSLGAIPGTGPATSPLPVIKKITARTLADLPVDRTLVMGILNITEDSFSDGGKYTNADDAISHGLRMYYGGADIIDVGGESTRPGADPVDPAEEQKRILPVIKALAKAGAIISVDTMHTSTARAALEAGAHIINDVSGLTHEPDMPALMAETGAPYVLMHRRGDAASMVTEASYTDVVTEVLAELTELRERFIAAGVKPEALILDPGLGFAKDHEHNWELLNALDRFTALGHRVLVGTSRKRFLGALLTVDGKPAAPAQRDAATAATSALAAANGAWGVRVHDVPSSLDAIKVARAWSAARVPAL
ncbi:dihydropteroate synthase [Paeniglutamicibacter sp. ABSL32-1]|uniref:dihydropteroate synthase n=1 Tax=Paeniglutamicibacter quisquiliarum TaxID=2849498 RepID=UPI001C2CD470|nr:dihydropteroate synthase [Paeniglutamicibacter quisquiliarum]MBV1781124.1 dihydropteroate synthase [Paeniglutamicibacter quisquiliarum]